MTQDAEHFADRAWSLLAARPVESSLALTVTDRLRSGRPRPQQPPVLAWSEEEGTVTGAAVLTPPRSLVLAEVRPGAVVGLVATLTEHGVVVPGVTGEEGVVAAFVGAWTSRHGVRARTVMQQRLYRLDRLVPPPAPRGRARPAGTADVDLAARWFDRFEEEALPSAGVGGSRPLVQDRVESRLLWLWERDGTVVSLAARSATVAGVARVAPVWTPPELRRRGYGTAVTAACTLDALQRGAVDVVLYTDRANHTSNDIYQQLGFRAVHDCALVELEPEHQPGHADSLRS